MRAAALEHLAPTLVMRFGRACLPLVMCLLATLAGCGSPLTGIYAENQGPISFVLVFRAAGFLPVSKALSANSQGNVFQERVEAIGEVQLLATNCQVVSTATAGPGNVLISVVDGQLKVASGVDLSGRPATFLGDDDTCTTLNPNGDSITPEELEVMAEIGN